MSKRRLQPESVDALFCIAIVSELAPMLGLLHQIRLRSHRLCVGRLAHHRVAVLRCGVGPASAGRRTAATLRRLQPRSVWSIGSCGAIRDDLELGTVVTSRSVLSPDGRTWSAHPVPTLPSVVAQTVEQPVFTAVHRAQVARSGAEICEMEASAVLQAVNGRCPVHLVKVVSDRAGGEPDPALLVGSTRAKARFHQRVERLMRAFVMPRLVHQLQATLAPSDEDASTRPMG